MWILFVAIGAGMLAVLAYGWGLARGSELTRAAHARLHQAVRDSAALTIQAHEREHAAWLAAELATQSYLLSRAGTRETQRETRAQRDEAAEAAEMAHDATRDAIEALRAALDDPNHPELLDQARRRSERRADEAAKRRSEREQRDSVDSDADSQLLS